MPFSVPPCVRLRLLHTQWEQPNIVRDALLALIDASAPVPTVLTARALGRGLDAAPQHHRGATDGGDAGGEEDEEEAPCVQRLLKGLESGGDGGSSLEFLDSDEERLFEAQLSAASAMDNPRLRQVRLRALETMHSERRRARHRAGCESQLFFYYFHVLASALAHDYATSFALSVRSLAVAARQSPSDPDLSSSSSSLSSSLCGGVGRARPPSLTPSTQSSVMAFLRREPAVFAAVENACRGVWHMQCGAHAGSAAGQWPQRGAPDTGAAGAEPLLDWYYGVPGHRGDAGGGVCAARRCPLCYAAEVEHVQAMAALLGAQEYCVAYSAAMECQRLQIHHEVEQRVAKVARAREVSRGGVFDIDADLPSLRFGRQRLFAQLLPACHRGVLHGRKASVQLTVEWLYRADSRGGGRAVVVGCRCLFCCDRVASPFVFSVSGSTGGGASPVDVPGGFVLATTPTTATRGGTDALRWVATASVGVGGAAAPKARSIPRPRVVSLRTFLLAQLTLLLREEAAVRSSCRVPRPGGSVTPVRTLRAEPSVAVDGTGLVSSPYQGGATTARGSGGGSSDGEHEEDLIVSLAALRSGFADAAVDILHQAALEARAATPSHRPPRAARGDADADGDEEAVRSTALHAAALLRAELVHLLAYVPVAELHGPCVHWLVRNGLQVALRSVLAWGSEAEHELTAGPPPPPLDHAVGGLTRRRRLWHRATPRVHPADSQLHVVRVVGFSADGGGSGTAAAAAEGPLGRLAAPPGTLRFPAVSNSFDVDGETLLGLAVRRRDKIVARLLLLHGASTRQSTGWDGRALLSLLPPRATTAGAQPGGAQNDEAEEEPVVAYLRALLTDPAAVIERRQADLHSQLRGALSAASAAQSLAGIAAKLWKEKVAALVPAQTGAEAYYTAHDKLLRLSTAALEFDAHNSTALEVLHAVLRRKLVDAAFYRTGAPEVDRYFAVVEAAQSQVEARLRRHGAHDTARAAGASPIVPPSAWQREAVGLLRERGRQLEAEEPLAAGRSDVWSDILRVLQQAARAEAAPSVVFAGSHDGRGPPRSSHVLVELLNPKMRVWVRLPPDVDVGRTLQRQCDRRPVVVGLYGLVDGDVGLTSTVRRDDVVLFGWSWRYTRFIATRVIHPEANLVIELPPVCTRGETAPDAPLEPSRRLRCVFDVARPVDDVAAASGHPCRRSPLDWLEALPPPRESAVDDLEALLHQASHHTSSSSSASSNGSSCSCHALPPAQQRDVVSVLQQSAVHSHRWHATVHAGRRALWLREVPLLPPPADRNAVPCQAEWPPNPVVAVATGDALSVCNEETVALVGVRGGRHVIEAVLPVCLAPGA